MIKHGTLLFAPLLLFEVCSVPLASAFTPLLGRVQPSARGFPTVIFSDGNPPPFGDWGQPQQPPAPPAAAPPSSPYADWGQPATSSGAAAAGGAQEAPPTWGAPPTAAAPPPAPSAAAVAPPAATGGGGVGDAITTLTASQEAVLAKIQAAIPDLTYKPDLSWPSSESIGGAAAKLDAWDAPGASNVAWLSSLCIDQKVSSLTIFNGPLTDVPHVLSRVVDNGNTLEFALDIRPRAYGAYETADAQGNYPGPEELGRKAFEYSGARNEFFNKFATDAVQSIFELSQFEGATELPQSDLTKKTGGPLALHLSMPNTPSNVAQIAQRREQVAEAWLTWSAVEGDTHAHRPGAPVNTQYVYDAKFRQNAYSALLEYYSTLLGPSDGARLAAAESGPLDEAYVGGGS